MTIAEFIAAHEASAMELLADRLEAAASDLRAALAPKAKRVRTTKLCSLCNETKPLAGFWVNRTRPDGRSAYCISCEKEKHPSAPRNAARKKKKAPPVSPRSTSDNGAETPKTDARTGGAVSSNRCARCGQPGHKAPTCKRDAGDAVRRCSHADEDNPKVTCGALVRVGRERKHLIEVHDFDAATVDNSDVGENFGAPVEAIA